MTGRLLTARVVAGRLGVTAETVLRCPRQGELPVVHILEPRDPLPRNELGAWLDRRTTPHERQDPLI